MQKSTFPAVTRALKWVDFTLSVYRILLLSVQSRIVIVCAYDSAPPHPHPHGSLQCCSAKLLSVSLENTCSPSFL